MTENQKGQYYQPPDVPTVRTWTICGLRDAMTQLGKPFTPAEEIKDRLEGDLADGVLVLFTKEDVQTVVNRGTVPRSYESALVELVEDKNDAAVIPGERVEEWYIMANRLKYWGGH